MPTNFPGSVDTFSVKVDNVTDVMAADVNNLQDAMVAVQNRIGTTAAPNFVTMTGNQTIAGNKTFSGDVTVASRVLMGNATSPNTATLQWGDNSGWTFRMMTNVSGTPTLRYSFTDTGNFTASGNITANGQFSGNGAGLTNLSAAAILNATAGAAVGAVGTYAFLATTNVTSISAGSTYAGSALRYAAIGDAYALGGYNGGTQPVDVLLQNTAPAGTWRCMGGSSTWGSSNIASVFLRIS